MNESNLNASVGLKLRTLRLARHVKQADAARDLGVSPAYLNLIEKGKRVMPFPLLWKALRYFDQDPEQFMGSLGQGPVDETLAKLAPKQGMLGLLAIADGVIMVIIGIVPSILL